MSNLASLLTENNPAYRRSALELASLVSLKDLADFNNGTYFDQNLFLGFLNLLAGINEVAVEIAKLPSVQGEDLPNWVRKNSEVQRVIVV